MEPDDSHPQAALYRNLQSMVNAGIITEDERDIRFERAVAAAKAPPPKVGRRRGFWRFFDQASERW